MKRQIKIILGFSFFSLILLASGSFVLAQNSTTGWLWSGTSNTEGTYNGMGWISVSSQNQSGDDGILYSLSLPESDGNVSGYAWTPYYGWIDFDPIGPYPAEPAHSAMKEGDRLTGWARILSIANAGANAGGWDGWIKLSGSNYGVNLSVIERNSNGNLYEPTYAWSSELGWIDFGRMGSVPFTPVASNEMQICETISSTPLLANDIFIGLNEEREYKVYYNNTGTCDGTDITSATLWTGTNGPSDAVTVDNKKIIAGSDAKPRGELVNVEYTHPVDGTSLRKLHFHVTNGGIPSDDSNDPDDPNEKEIWKEVAP